MCLRDAGNLVCYMISVQCTREMRGPGPQAYNLLTISERKNAKTMRELCVSAGHQKVQKNGGNLIFFFSTIYYATADIPVSSDNFPTQEDSCRYNLAVVRFSYCFLNFKKDFKAVDVPVACKQIASTSLLLSWTFLQKVTI